MLLQELNLFENFDAAGLGYLTAEAVHVMTECKRLAFADREAFMADPDFVDVPIEGMLDKEYSSERAALIEFEHALSENEVQEGDPWAFVDRTSRRFEEVPTRRYDPLPERIERSSRRVRLNRCRRV